MSVDQVGSKDSDNLSRRGKHADPSVSVDQVGSKDSDTRCVVCVGVGPRVSVDQVGSKDSDNIYASCTSFSIKCPLIRLVPRTATLPRRDLLPAVFVSVDQVGSKDSDLCRVTAAGTPGSVR